MSMNFAETKRFLHHIWKTNLVPCLLGHTGLGKTELFRQIAKELGMDLITIHVAQLAPEDFVGLPHITGDNRTGNSSPNWLPYKPWDAKDHDKYREMEATVTDAKELAEVLAKLLPPNGEGWINPNGGIIFLDEINRGHEDMRQAMYQFLQEGRIHTWVKPDSYKLASAANPGSEGYETQEFDPALMNRMAWVNFVPDFEESSDYLLQKYGKNPVMSWVLSNKSVVDYGSDFKIDGKLYPPRMFENHIQLYNSVRKEDKKFQHKVYQTIMQDEKALAFMAFLKDSEFVNYVDIMQGVDNSSVRDDKGMTKSDKLKDMVTNRDDNLGILSTIVTDLGDEFCSFEFGASEKKYIPEEGGKPFIISRDNEYKVEERVVDFLNTCPDELVSVFLERLSHGFGNKKGIKNQKYFRQIFKPRLANRNAAMGIPTKK